MAEVAKKKRNPQDSTLRNVRAANKKLEALDNYVMQLALGIAALTERVERLEKTAHTAGRRK